MASNKLLNQGLWLEGGVTSFNQATLFEPGQLGMFYEKNGKKYQLVQRDSNDATSAFVAGAVVSWVDRSAFKVTADISAAAQNFVAGVAQETAAAGNYTFIQVRGNYATVKTNGDDDIALGDIVVADASTDGVADSVVASVIDESGSSTVTVPAVIPLGVATADDVDANDTVAVDLLVPLNGV